jgi:uncharacterized protein (TIGR03118 family)
MQSNVTRVEPMKTKCSVLALTFLAALNCTAVYGDEFSQTNLVADTPAIATANNAKFFDPNLVDPWGMSFSATSPIWVSDRATGVSTVYNGAGVATPIVVSVPPGAPAGPTGQVFAGGTNFSVTSNGQPALFIFDTLGGTIDAWNSALGITGTATVEVTTPGAHYEGLALANNTLYAANFVNGGTIDVFNSSYAKISTSGGFVDPNIPTGYAPFNIQNINGKLYVEYAKLNPNPNIPVPAPGTGGYVDVFDTNGNLVQRLISNGNLDAPWGVALAPSTWGSFANDLLVGNFGNGEINAYDPTNGNWLGTLMLSNGMPFAEPGLWGIAFGNGANAGSTNSLYFAAGINGGDDGLFGHLDPVPEPASLMLLGLGIGALALKRVARPAPLHHK